MGGAHRLCVLRVPYSVTIALTTAWRGDGLCFRLCLCMPSDHAVLYVAPSPVPLLYPGRRQLPLLPSGPRTPVSSSGSKSEWLQPVQRQPRPSAEQVGGYASSHAGAGGRGVCIFTKGRERGMGEGSSG